MKVGEIVWGKIESPNAWAQVKDNLHTYNVGRRNIENGYKYWVYPRSGLNAFVPQPFDTILELACWLEDKEPAP